MGRVTRVDTKRCMAYLDAKMAEAVAAAAQRAGKTPDQWLNRAVLDYVAKPKAA